jgi:DNA-binding MarR family transcriptional regulator
MECSGAIYGYIANTNISYRDIFKLCNNIVLRYTVRLIATMADESMEVLSAEDYRVLAEVRHRIREFLQFSEQAEQAARSRQIEPAQHQLLLTIKASPDGVRPSIRDLSRRLLLKHNSTGELVGRLEHLGMVRRIRSANDRREVLVELTPKGEELLQDLTFLHREELASRGPGLLRALRSAVRRARTARGTRQTRSISDA